MARRNAPPPSEASDPRARLGGRRGQVIDEEDRGLVYDVADPGLPAVARWDCSAPSVPARSSPGAGARRHVDVRGGSTASGLGVGGSSSSSSAVGRPDRGAGRDRRALPGRRLERRQRARRLRHRPLRHPLGFGVDTTIAEGVPLTIRLTVRDAASGDAAAARGLPLALQPGGRVLALLPGPGEHQLPARRAGGRRQRHRRVHLDLPGGVRRPLAAHPLRGVRGRRQRHVVRDRS